MCVFIFALSVYFDNNINIIDIYIVYISVKTKYFPVAVIFSMLSFKPTSVIGDENDNRMKRGQIMC